MSGMALGQRERHFYAVVHMAMVLLHLGLSLVFLISEDDRFSAPAWEPLFNLTGHRPEPLGLVLGVAGFLMLHNRPFTDALGGIIATLWMILLSATFVVALEDPRASATGIIAYGVFAAINAALVTQRVLDWQDRPRRSKRTKG